MNTFRHRAREGLRTTLEPALIRARRNGRIVAWIPEWMGWGNQVMGWFWAWRGLSRGQERFLLQTHAMTPWVDLFPQARRFTLLRSEVGFLDRRLMPKESPMDDGAPPFSKDYSSAEQEAFIHEVLLSSGRFRDLVRDQSVGPDALVINIRRGDYYTADHVHDFGMNITGYVREAVARSVHADGVPTAVHIVSDDLDWCLRNLPFLADIAPVTHPDPDARTPFSDLATLAGSRRLVLTNSTFSYWGGHLSNALHRDNHHSVWAPSFFIRSQNGGRTWLTDDRWPLVEDVPGGWEPVEP